jgi:hypothetical protein
MNSAHDIVQLLKEKTQQEEILSNTKLLIIQGAKMGVSIEDIDAQLCALVGEKVYLRQQLSLPQPYAKMGNPSVFTYIESVQGDKDKHAKFFPPLPTCKQTNYRQLNEQETCELIKPLYFGFADSVTLVRSNKAEEVVYTTNDVAFLFSGKTKNTRSLQPILRDILKRVRVAEIGVYHIVYTKEGKTVASALFGGDGELNSLIF